MSRFDGLFRLGLIGLSFSTVFGPLSPEARGANVIVLDADPFASDAAQVLDSRTASDWTSLPDPLPGVLAVTGETFDPVAGLVLPTRLVLGPAPAGARYLLVNQVEPDIAVFDYTEALPGGMVDSDRNGLPDYWEYHYFARLGVDPDSDVDGDGFAQQAEGDAGTDPLSPDSKPAIPGLIGVWRGEEDTRDSAGGHDGTWNGPARYARGNLGRAYDLRGDNFLRVAAEAALRPASGFTIAAWVKLSELSGNPKPILTWPSSLVGIPALGLAVDAQGPRLRMATAYGSRYDGPIISLSTNVWYHMAACWDTTEIKLYLNGRIACGLRLPAGFGPLDFAPGQDLLLGHDGHIGYLTGLLDEAILAGRALTAAEVLALAGGNSSPRGVVPDGALVVERQDQTVWWLPPGASGGRFVTHGYDARLSGDRRWLLFRRASTEPVVNGGEGLWRRDLVSGQESFLFTLDKSDQSLGFDWSADATSAVFADAQTGRIERRAFSGEAPALLLSTGPAAPMDLAVSRTDGRLAWFASTGRTAEDRPWVAGWDGSSASAIPGTQAADYFSRYRLPAWSIDGQWIALRSGRNLLKLRPDGTDFLALTQFTGTGGELRLHDAAAAWTPDGKHLVAIASPSGSGSDTRLLWIPSDGAGDNVERTLDGSPPVGIVFGGDLAAPDWRLVLDLVPATQPGGTPHLRFEVPEGNGLLLESTDALDSTWRTGAPVERIENGRRYWELPIPANSSVRFYRLRIVP